MNNGSNTAGDADTTDEAKTTGDADTTDEAKTADGAGPNGDFDWLSLDDGETILWGDTPHRYSLVPALLVGIPLSIFIVGLFVIAGAYLSHVNTNYVVTTNALYRKTGILSRNVQRIEFGKVQDTSYRQSAIGAHFGYGTVDVSTAGGSGVEMSFRNVEEPQRLQALINERLRDREEPTDASGDATAVLDEILAELRALRRTLEEGERSQVDADQSPIDAERSTNETGAAGTAVDEPVEGNDE